jgi:hypothetical protein
VIFPAGAVSTDTTFRIAVDSTGAPPVPSDMGGTGNIYMVTPHGGDFAQEVEVRIPVPNVTLQPNQQFKLAKAEPGGEWTILNETEIVDGKLSAKVNSFSFFIGTVVNYLLPIVQQPPFDVTSSLDCGPLGCTDRLGPVTATYSVVGNGGQLPENGNCSAGSLSIRHASGSRLNAGPLSIVSIPFAGGANTSTVVQNWTLYHAWLTELRCTGWRTEYRPTRHLVWRTMPYFPGIEVLSVPARLDVVEGHLAEVDSIIGGGAPQPTVSDSAVIDWERSDDNGSSWRVIARSFQHEGDPRPFDSGEDWRPWSVRHGFIATATDQGALIRQRPCYTPPAPTTVSPTSCIAGPTTRINVLQQSALPAIVDAPRSVLIRTGQTANFSVTASGLPAPSLQWQMRAANSTGEWANVEAGTGATSSNYTTPPLALSDNGLQFRVVATNAVGSVTSTPVSVSVNDVDVAPTITSHPGALIVISGSDAVFAVVATGTEALSYQWRFNGTNIPGENSSVLRLRSVSSANDGIYSVVVTNNAGSATSGDARMLVTQVTPDVVAPTIATQPAPVTVNSGNVATFAVGVNGTGPFTFQWRRDGNNITGANAAALTLNNVALPNAGLFSVVVSNSAGTIVSSDALLTVAEASGAIAPTITSQPSTLIVPSGGSGFLAVGATGSGPLSYQWQFNGTPISGATLPVLSLTNVDNTNVGNYTVTVTNSVTSTTSQAAQLILLGAPVINTDPVATTAAENQTATFSVAAEGSGLRYQWLLNSSPISGATSASYTTPSLVAANSGAVYSVMVYNGAGLVFSQGAVLTVQVIVAPSVTEQPTNVTIQPGAAAAICAAFGGTTPLDVWLQRLVSGVWTNTGSAPLPTTNVNTCFYSPNLQLADSGAQFRLFASNLSGQVATNTVTVTVSAPPPSSETTLVSATVTGGVPGYESSKPSISADGRYVAFTSHGQDLIPGGTTTGTNSGHAYLRDRTTGTTTLINQTTSGGVSSHGVVDLRLSSNGGYAVFTSLAADLVAGDTNGSMDVFRRNLVTGVTERVNLLEDGSQVIGEGNATYDARLSISGNGRVIAYLSPRNMFNSEPNGNIFLYYRDMQTTVSEYVAGNADSPPIGDVAISDNGECLAYTPGIPATDLQTINVYDIEADVYLELFSFVQSPSPNGLRPGISISANCRYVAFSAVSTGMSGNAFSQIFVTDMQSLNTATLMTVGANGVGNGDSEYPILSGDGRYLMFITAAQNLTEGQAAPNQRFLVVRDMTLNTLDVVSRRPDNVDIWLGATGGHVHALSLDGSTVAFMADHAVVMGGAAGNQVFAGAR